MLHGERASAMNKYQARRPGRPPTARFALAPRLSASLSTLSSPQAFLALGMLITGSINTIANKLADGERSKGVWADGCPASPPPAAPPPPNFPLSPGLAPPPPAQACKFIHPFFQALVMFIGEASCLVVFFSDRCVRSARGQPVEKVQPFNKFIFLLPACCDMTATSLMYIGLLLTYASFFQMLRSSVVLFTAIISRVFLKKQLQPFHWVGCALVLAGTVIVGLDSVINPAKDASSSAPNATLGNALVIASQLIVAIQMCVEEVFVGAANVAPLLAVGLEGVFGASMLTLLLIPMYYAIPGIENLSETSQHFEDSYDALLQLGNNAVLLLWVLGGLFSIAFFNFFGISVTKNMSAAHRMVLDSLRTMVVWGYSLATGQAFSWLQLGGCAPPTASLRHRAGPRGRLARRSAPFAGQSRTARLLVGLEIAGLWCFSSAPSCTMRSSGCAASLPPSPPSPSCSVRTRRAAGQSAPPAWTTAAR